MGVGRIEHSRSTPYPLTIAAFTWRLDKLITIPDEVLALSESELLAWVSARVREHYRKKNRKDGLNGEVTGYRLVMAPHRSVRLDIEGRLVETKDERANLRHPYLEFGNKTLELRRDGTLKIDAVKENGK